MVGINPQINHLTDVSSWRSLTVFAGYRLFLSAVLLAVFHLALPPDFMGSTNPELYNGVSLLYFLIAIGFLGMTLQKGVPYESQTKLHLVTDIIVITLLINASGGLSTNLGSLLVVVVVAGGVLMPGRLSIFIAAIATIAILAEAIYSQLFDPGQTQYSNAGILGATFFATAVLTHVLSRKIAESQQLADERAADIVNLAMINENIISRMQTGVLVVDKEGKIQLINQSARQLLGLETADKSTLLKQVVPELADQLAQWKQQKLTAFTPFQAHSELPELAVNAMLLESGETVLYIDNRSAVSQQAQQLKLASLGQLTASIAHEVRNPLGAISHAGELLAEANNDQPEMRKLTDIIQRHSTRVNTIIETILEMSRRKTVEPTVVVLAAWLEHLLDEFIEYKQIDEHKIAVQIRAPLANVYIDEEQLRQVMWNILDNAWHYSTDNTAGKRIELLLDEDGDEVRIDIIDNGPGVSASMQPTLFEPFQSERQGGTGLGLYLARELCQANRVRLNYSFERLNKSCFSLHIPIKQQENLT